MVVVVGLEMVAVAEEQRELAVVAAATFELLFQSFVQVAVVVESGQAVGDRFDPGPAEADGGGLQRGRQRV
jgi:hypothetical protein